MHNRRQHVSIGSTKSGDIVITRGVPQGPVLGPLLFLLYINDLSNRSELFDFHTFVDDTDLFYSNRSLAELEDVINNNLWLMANKLSSTRQISLFFTPLKSQQVTQSNYYSPIGRLNKKILLNI